MTNPSSTNGAATFSVEKPAVQKYFALECEVCAVNLRFTDFNISTHAWLGE